MSQSKSPLAKQLGHNTLQVDFPHWLVLFYAGAAALLLPWTIYLSLTLPSRHSSHNWDVVWGGFDIFVIILLSLTAYFAARRSLWVALTSSALGTALLVDGWFDILTSRTPERPQAVILAILVEIPVATLSWFFATRAIQQSLRLANDVTDKKLSKAAD